MCNQPVIERELRVQARRAGTYWLRVLAGIVAGGALGAALLARDEWAYFGGARHGAWLFALLHTIISIVLAVACPLLTADTLARERREGTLGILLLTPVGPASIVLGKMAAHLIRTFMIWLAVVPVLIVPLLLGGVAAVDVLFVLVLQLGVVLGSLAAGLIVSSLVLDAGAAVGGAILLALVLGETLALTSFVAVLPYLLAHPSSDYSRHLAITATLGPWLLGTGLIENGFSGVLGRCPAWFRPAVFGSLAAVFIGSLILAVLAVRFAAWRVGQIPAGSSTPRQEARRRFWRRSQFPQVSRAWRLWQLRCNPVLWLYSSQLGGGLGQWAWCGVVLLVWAYIGIAGWDDADMAPLVVSLPLGLAVGLAHAASGSFRQELDDGSLELLLVTPISPFRIVQARIVALWRAFLPAVFISMGLAALWMLNQSGKALPSFVWLLASISSCLAIPAIGARLSVRGLHPVSAWLLTLLVSGAAPGFFAMLAAFTTTPEPQEFGNFHWRFLGFFILFQLGAAVFCAWCTGADMATRSFRLKPLRRRQS